MTVLVPTPTRCRGARPVGVVLLLLGGLLVHSAPATAAPAPATWPGTANLLVNGSFEQPKLADGSYRAFKAIPGWSVDPRTPPIEVQRGTVGPAERGFQYLETDSVAPAQVHQSFTVPPGDGPTCTLLVSYAPRPAVADNHISVVVSDPSGTVAALDLAADGSEDPVPAWRNASTTFPAGPDPAHTVTINDLSVRDGFGMLVDEVFVRCG